MSRRIAVIGGGLAGLAAAARIRTLGGEPVIFERDAAVGGVVRTVERDGWLFDTGATMAAEPGAEVRDLLTTAGLDQYTTRAAAVGATRYIVLNGTPVALPRTTSEFASSSLLSLGGRLRLIKERLIPARRDTTDESVDSFARRRFGDEMAERMFDPLIASTCAGDPRQIVARFAFPGVVGHERGSGSSVQGGAKARMDARRRAKGRPTGSWSCTRGMQQLPEQLAQFAGTVRTGTPVDGVAARGEKFDVTSNGSTEPFDAVILAVPAHALASIGLDVPASNEFASIAAMPHASIATVSLGYHREQVTHALDCSRLLIPSVERRPVLSMVFPASLFAERAPVAHVLVTAFVGGAMHPALVDRSDAELESLVQQEAQALLGALGSPVTAQVTRWHNALPQAVTGHGERLAAADRIEAATPGVALTGAWRDGLAIGEVLLGGMRAADRIATRQGWVTT